MVKMKADLKKNRPLKNIKDYFKNKAVTILITVTMIIIVDAFKIPNPAIVCLIGVVFSAFIGGYIYGSISGIITFVYCAYFFSDNHSIIYYNNENEYKLLVIVLALVTMVFMVGALKKSVDNHTKELEIANSKLMELSITDELTGLYNYRHFINTLNKEWGRSLRNKSSISIAIIDIDFFKKYNDYYGHHAGNECLSQVAEIIKKQLNRPTDFAARYGGEEFAIILTDTEADGAKLVMKKVHSEITNHRIENKASDQFSFLTVSIGVATIIPEKNQTFEMLIKQADIELYNAKRSGRNAVLQYVKTA